MACQVVIACVTNAVPYLSRLEAPPPPQTWVQWAQSLEEPWRFIMHLGASILVIAILVVVLMSIVCFLIEIMPRLLKRIIPPEIEKIDRNGCFIGD